MDFDNTLKIIAVGNGTVGKTSLAQRFCNGHFTADYKKTLAVDFIEKTQYVESLDKEIVFSVYDTAGQEEYDSLTSQYYRGAQGALVVFATDNRASFDNVVSWVSKIHSHCDESLPIALVQNKIDLVDSSVVTEEEAMQKAEELGVSLFRTSALDNANVTDVFEYLALRYYALLEENGEEEDDYEDFTKETDDATKVNQIIALEHQQQRSSKKWYQCSIL
ncbi:hypothetical protein P9112_006432 [Eukaryota sp. TZLM1-RC]